MEIISIIPARGGSKGVPGKNIKLLDGKPLISYSIASSLGSSLVGRTIVSTDDLEIADVAKRFGAEVYMRPKQLAADDSKTDDVLVHVVETLKREGYHPDLIVLLQPTSPLREKEDIDNAINVLLRSNSDSLLSVCEFPYFLWKIRDGLGAPINYDPSKKRPFHQEMQQYKENGSIYITKKEILLKNKCRLGGSISLYVMQPENSFEIDTHFDFWLIEKIKGSKNAGKI
ncbi:acylneuraminate cytidylyltransferase family protein [Candidatus Woesearchaeota archaeon]|nr:acylneuraminate cytidylyltransferase family protein [Candidatus Woesearchaeota archaeon]